MCYILEGTEYLFQSYDIDGSKIPISQCSSQAIRNCKAVVFNQAYFNKNIGGPLNFMEGTGIVLEGVSPHMPLSLSKYFVSVEGCTKTQQWG